MRSNRKQTELKAFENQTQFFIFLISAIAISLAIPLLHKAINHSLAGDRAYWWGISALGSLYLLLEIGFYASLIACFHEKDGVSKLRSLLTRMGYVLATTITIVLIIGVLNYIGAILDPKNAGMPRNIGMIPVWISFIFGVLLTYASAFAGAGKMRLLDACVASLRFIKSCKGLGLIFLLGFVALTMGIFAFFHGVAKGVIQIALYSIPFHTAMMIIGIAAWKTSEQMPKIPHRN